MNRPPHRQYSKTRDLHLAAYLFARGATIVGVQADERKAVFTFLSSLDLKNWIDEFRSGKAPIDACVFVLSIKTLKHKALDVLMECHGRE
jgi:Domain of unknown function (DUF5659)